MTAINITASNSPDMGLGTALKDAKSGDVINLIAGDYFSPSPPTAPSVYPWEIPSGVTLAGASSGARAVIHGGMQMLQPNAVLQSLCVTDAPQRDGIDCQAPDCVIKGCQVYNNLQGIGAWQGSERLLIEDTIVYRNGISGHGHGIYWQNPAGKGVKTLRRCVIVANGNIIPLHAYSEQGDVFDFLAEDCIFIGGPYQLVGGWRPGGGYVFRNCQFLDTGPLVGWSGINSDVLFDGCVFYSSTANQTGINVRATQHVTIRNCVASSFQASFTSISNPELDGENNVFWLGGNIFSFPPGWSFPTTVAARNTNPAPAYMLMSYGTRYFIDQDPRYRGWGPGPKLTPPAVPDALLALKTAFS